MRVAIMQPSYLPYLGYFDLIKRSDVFVFYDDVPMTKNDWRNRNRIKTPQGEMWLTIPTGKRRGYNINEVPLPPGPWLQKHLKAIRMNYAKSKWCPDQYERLEYILKNGVALKKFADFCIFIIASFCEDFRIETLMTTPGELGIGRGAGRTERLVEICNHLKANEYLSPNGSRPYLDTKQFEDAGIKVIWQDYDPKVYSQQWGGPFIPRLSFIDLLLNEGEDAHGFI